MSSYGPKSDLNKAGGEQSDFPILCETCLGPNPYVRMSKQSLGAECKICTRPFTVFRWLPGAGMRYKKTEVCQTCAKIKNVCQTCLLDLQFSLPTQVRDAALKQKSTAPSSSINREYYAQNMEEKIADGTTDAVSFGKVDSAGRELLKKLARNDPYYKRNRPHLCSFFAKGECNRGDACPYRHEKPTTQSETTSSRQSIQDRYHGKNDPVAEKILNKSAASAGLAPPEDESIVSLFVSNLPDEADEAAVRSTFSSYVQPSQIKNVVYVSASKVAFVNFVDRQAAEEAARQCALECAVADQPVKVSWGRSRPKKTSTVS